MTSDTRRATAADIAAVYRIELASFRNPWPVTAFEDELDNDVAIFKVVEAGGEVAGYYDLWVAADEAHLLNVAVADGHRRRGYGERLVRDAMAEGRAAGCVRIYLEVRAGNGVAVRLYERLGFQVIGRRRRYYADGEDAAVMAAPL